MPIKFEDDAGEQRYVVDESQLDRGVLTTPYDAPVRTLITELQEKALVVNPSFQRYSVWNTAKQAKLIESLLLNIPIPVLYFAEDEDGTRVVVDGQQRLRAIEEFYSGTFRLRDLEVLASLNGLRWADLSNKHANIILRRTLRCVVISATSPQTLRFEMFERLNTGGVPLNDQELRNCVFHGRLNNLLKELAINSTWRSALNLKRPDRRMDDMELALRFFAMREILDTYRPPLKEALNNFMRANRNPDDTSLNALRDALLTTVGKVRLVFGSHIFRRIRRDERTNSPIWDRNINRAVFDVQMLSLESLASDVLQNRADDVRSAFENLCVNDREFWESLSLATANRSAVLNRLRRWGRTLADLGLEPNYLETLPES